MSGVYKPLVIGFGALSSIIAVFVIHRMNVVDQDRIPLKLHPLRMILYWGWLMGEIVKSNIAVTKTILSRDMPIRQNLFTTACSQKTELAQVIFANSITLTPGTITVETEDDHFWVHALSYCDDDPAALDDMDARVLAVETGGRA
jgi:multicomponent Na+:H+ antiporter subunit E